MSHLKILLSSFFVISTIAVGNVSVADASTHHHHHAVEMHRKEIAKRKSVHPHRSIADEHPVWYAPLMGLSESTLVRVECVIYRESTSTLAHPNLGDNNANPGYSGIFQMSNQPDGVWDAHVLPYLHVQVWDASAYQQAQGFILVWRVDGFAPWHLYDGC